MDTSLRTVQTAFRFSPGLVKDMKNKARREGKSVNAYVENLIKKDIGTESERYEAIYRELAQWTPPEKVRPEIEALSSYAVEYTQDEIDADPRLAYLLEKHCR
ncbi:MAG: hypothetical protein KBS55_01400 [Bacteroidales bacterium]|nr:hypothetical protein [Candidatus Cryptobacteroides aphodequi]